jgi:hypothetical protein
MQRTLFGWMIGQTQRLQAYVVSEWRKNLKHKVTSLALVAAEKVLARFADSLADPQTR